MAPKKMATTASVKAGTEAAKTQAVTKVGKLSINDLLAQREVLMNDATMTSEDKDKRGREIRRLLRAQGHFIRPRTTETNTSDVVDEDTLTGKEVVMFESQPQEEDEGHFEVEDTEDEEEEELETDEEDEKE